MRHVENNANIEACAGGKNNTPLLSATMNGHLPIIKYLISRGANLLHVNGYKNTIFHIAVYMQRQEVIDYVFQFYDIKFQNDCDSFKDIILKAISYNNCNAVSYLLSKGFRVDEFKIDENIRTTPMYNALSEGNIEIVKLLEQHGAKINSSDSTGHTALYISASSNNLELVQYICSKGVDINYPCGYYWETTLHLACVKDFFNIAKFLLSIGADISKRNKTGLTPALVACQKGNIRILNLLLQHGVDINERSYSGNTLLHIACEKKNPSIIFLLLSLGADVNCVNTQGFSPIFNIRGCWQNELVCMKLMLRVGSQFPKVSEMRKFYYSWTLDVFLYIFHRISFNCDFETISSLVDFMDY